MTFPIHHLLQTTLTPDSRSRAALEFYDYNVVICAEADLDGAGSKTWKMGDFLEIANDPVVIRFWY